MHHLHLDASFAHSFGRTIPCDWSIVPAGSATVIIPLPCHPVSAYLARVYPLVMGEDRCIHMQTHMDRSFARV